MNVSLPATDSSANKVQHSACGESPDAGRVRCRTCTDSVGDNHYVSRCFEHFECVVSSPVVSSRLGLQVGRQRVGHGDFVLPVLFQRNSNAAKILAVLLEIKQMATKKNNNINSIHNMQ